jgi:hypothetical protein
MSNVQRQIQPVSLGFQNSQFPLQQINFVRFLNIEAEEDLHLAAFTRRLIDSDDKVV